MEIKMIKNSISKLLLLTLGIMLSCQVLAAQSPDVLLKNISDRMLARLDRQKATLKSNAGVVYNLVEEILLPHVDKTGMARSVVGRSAWFNASPATRTRFTNEFTTLVVRTYSTALATYTNETIEFHPVRGGYAGKSRVQVSSLIVRNGAPNVPVDYRLILKGDRWYIYDMSVEGVSLLQSFRSQFAGELSRNNLASLVDSLAKHNRQSR